MKVLGIFGFTMVMWLLEGIGYPSVMCVLLIIVTQAMSYQNAFAVSWGNNLVIFVVAVFGLAEGIRRSGFTRRFALWFVSRPFTVGRPWVMISMFWLACMLMGSVMSGSATCITFMTVGVPLLEELGYKRGDKFAAMFITGIAWVASLSFISTPIGHGSNLLFIE
jgi:sodium-dependent dicarboxylate transporter 2/3/5